MNGMEFASPRRVRPVVIDGNGFFLYASSSGAYCGDRWHASFMNAFLSGVCCGLVELMLWWLVGRYFRQCLLVEIVSDLRFLMRCALHHGCVWEQGRTIILKAL